MEERIAPPFSRIVVIGGSAGALEVLFYVLPRLIPQPFPIVIVLHRRGSDDGGLQALLAGKTTLPVREVEDKEALMEGTIFIAPGDYHLLFEPDGTLSLDDSEKVAHSRPSIDVSFQSAALAYGDAVTGILLSGANADGVVGLGAIKEGGGSTIAQDPKTAEVPFMPERAVAGGVADRVLSAEGIVAFLNGG
jgi:two-component system chemotaxis response regulator CheB